MKRMMNTTRRERIHSQNRSLAHSIKEEAEQWALLSEQQVIMIWGPAHHCDNLVIPAFAWTGWKFRNKDLNKRNSWTRHLWPSCHWVLLGYSARLLLADRCHHCKPRARVRILGWRDQLTGSLKFGQRTQPITELNFKKKVDIWKDAWEELTGIQAVRSKRSSIEDLVLMRTKLQKWSSFSPHFTQKALSPQIWYIMGFQSVFLYHKWRNI